MCNFRWRAVSVFYEQLGNLLPKGTVISVGEGENLVENY